MSPQEFLVSLVAWIVVAFWVHREAKAQKVRGASPETWAIAVVVAGPIALPIFLHRRWQTIKTRLPDSLPRQLPGKPHLAIAAGLSALVLAVLWGALTVDVFTHQLPPPPNVQGFYVSEQGYAAFFSGLLALLHVVALVALLGRTIWSTAWGLWLPLFDVLAVLSGDATIQGWLPYDWAISGTAILMISCAWPLRRQWLGYLAAHHVTAVTPGA